MEIRGLPLHALVVHAAVVFGPLAALVSIAFAVLKKWRWALRWPSLFLAVSAVGSGLLAFYSGRDYLDANPELEQIAAVDTHYHRAEVLFWVIIAFGLIALIATFALSGPSALASGRGAVAERAQAVELSLAGLLVVAAVGLLVYTALVGDAGAQAVWGGG